MALTPVQIRNVAIDGVSIDEVLGVAFAMHARTVLAESAGPRRTFAVAVVANPVAAAQAWKWLILTAANLTMPPLPPALATAVAADWSMMAGA